MADDGIRPQPLGRRELRVEVRVPLDELRRLNLEHLATRGLALTLLERVEFRPPVEAALIFGPVDLPLEQTADARPLERRIAAGVEDLGVTVLVHRHRITHA